MTTSDHHIDLSEKMAEVAYNGILTRYRMPLTASISLGFRDRRGGGLKSPPPPNQTPNQTAWPARRPVTARVKSMQTNKEKPYHRKMRKCKMNVKKRISMRLTPKPTQ